MPRFPMSRLAALLLLLLVPACAPYPLVPANSAQAPQGIAVAPAIAFNRVSAFNPAVKVPERVEIWTSDGEVLDQLVFFGGVADGAPLVKLPETTAPREPLPPFRSSMEAGDVMELFAASLVRLGRTPTVETTALRPATFLGGPGFRFDFTYTGKDDIDRRGTAIGTVRDGKLWMIAFEGTRLLHYGRLLPEAERIFATAALRPS